MSNQTRLIIGGTVLAALVLAVLLVFSVEEPGGVAVPEQPVQETTDPLVRDGAPDVDVAAQQPRPEPGVVVREEVVSDATTGSLLIKVLWSDGESAPGIAIMFRSSTSGLLSGVLAREVSDERGEILVHGLPEGTARLYSDRGDYQNVEIAAGGQQEYEFVLAAGIEVIGVVTDRREMPVGGAAVWLQTHYNSWWGGRVVAHTEADGAFALSGIPPGLSLGAIAAGHAPSELIDLDLVDTSSPPVSVRLVLEDGGGAVEGRVTSRAGAPVEGALIVVGEAPDRMEHRGIDQWDEGWTQRTALSDEDGRFVLEGIRDGAAPIAVRAEGFGLWRSEVEVVAAERAWINVTLLEDVTVSGIVTDGQGEPLNEARVRAYDRAPRTPFIASGQIDFDYVFGYVGVLTDSEGRYRLGGVTPGEVYVFAQGKRDPGEFGRTIPHARISLEAEPSDELEWNPVVSLGRTIEGIVLYEDGHPMGLAFVTARDEGGDQRHILTTDTDGRFQFSGLEGASYSLHVQYRTPPANTPPLDRGGVVPDQGLVELRAPYPKPVEVSATAVVTGRIDDVGGRLPNPQAAEVRLSSARGFRRNPGIEDGAFRFDEVKPGRYRILVFVGGTTVVAGDWFEVAEAEVRDIGVLTTVPAGSLLIKLTRTVETTDMEPRVFLRHADGVLSALVEAGRRLEIPVDLTPGTYEVSGSADGMVLTKGEVEVRAGEESEVSLGIRPAARTNFVIWFPADREPGKTTTRVVEDGGEVFWEWESSNPQRPLELGIQVPRGEWRIEVTTENGLSGTTRFEIDALDREYPVRVDVK